MKNFPGLFSYLPAPRAQFIVLFRSASASICGQFRLRSALLMGLSVLPAISSPAQIQQAWVARYNNGITNGTHHALKMALDTSGNIYITGFSQNTNGNSGYATVKYAPNGNQIWTARYDSTNFPSAHPVGLALDTNGNAFVTGTALTAKYDSNGNQLWNAPYAGMALAVADGTNVVVTGFGPNFNTVKLTSSGTNLWSAAYHANGAAYGSAVNADASGNIYVSGAAVLAQNSIESYSSLTAIKYDANGNQQWMQQPGTAGIRTIVVVQARLDGNGNLYVESNTGQSAPEYQYQTTKISGDNGSLVWQANNPTSAIYSTSFGLALDGSNNSFVTGQNADYYPNGAYGTFKINTSGANVWSNYYPLVPKTLNVGTAITVDLANNVYVTGYSQGTNSSNNIVTIKYDNSGNQLWLESYSGPGGGGAAANAIAVDAGGNVYVTGYETVAGGGTEMVTIKYAPGASLQKQTNGAVLLQTQGNPGESFDFQASTNLQTWQDLGTNLADTNGQVQFLDTNASLFPYRFYQTNPR